MDTILQDVKFAARRLVQAPIFTAITVLTLALGIGANTAIFSVVNAVLLRPFPYRDPDALVTLDHLYPSINGMLAGVSAPGFKDYRDRNHVFESAAMEAPWRVNLTGRGDPERLNGARVSGQYFATFGVQAALGRTLLPEEDAPGREHVVVVSDGFWKRTFGADPSIVGRTLQINGERYEIVGVMPRGFKDFWSLGMPSAFASMRTIEMWSPLGLPSETFDDRNRTNEQYTAIARLKPGATLEQAQADITVLAEQLKKEHPGTYMKDWTVLLTTLSQKALGDIRPALLILLGAVSFVLLIACVNVANLLLARSAARVKEVAIRTALGADRARVVRQLLTESLLLAVGGALLGLAIAYAGVSGLVALAPDNVPRVDDVQIDATVLCFTLAVTLVTGLLFGIVPALRTSKMDLHETLKEGGRSGSSDVSGSGLRRALVVAEVALALTLVVGAGLLVKSFARLSGVDPGFDPARVLSFNLSLPDSKYADEAHQNAFFDAALARIASVPGVEAAGAVSNLPFSGHWWTGTFAVEHLQLSPGQPRPHGDLRIASADYFKAMRIPLVRGRYFEYRDGPDAPRVAVVDELLAAKYWPGENPLGKRLTFEGPRNDPRWREIVGVVGHVKHEALNAEARTQFYVPYRQLGQSEMDFAVRTSGDPIRFASAIADAVHGVDKDQPLNRILPLEGLVLSSMGSRRLSMWLLGGFAGLALVLASLGIYGVMAYSVTQRTRELGIRMALGAARGLVLRQVLGHGLRLSLAGVALGLLGAVGLTRLLDSQLYGVRATDPQTFAAVSVLLVVLSIVAAGLPALKATRVNPVVALRDE